MGAWALENFGNDDALALVDEAMGDTVAVVTGSLKAALDEQADDYLEAPDSARALAAAEFVAAALGHIPKDFPDEALSHLAVLKPDKDLIALAIRVVERVAANSELKELWEETDEFDAWLAVVQSLKQRLDLGRKS